MAEVVRRRVEATRDLGVGIRDEFGEGVGRDGGKDRDRSRGDVGVREVEIGADAGADGVPEIGGQARAANKVEGEFFADSGGGSCDDFFDGGFGDDGDVAAGGGLLESLKESAGLAESVVGAEVRLDLSKKDIHF